jgi:hypothetical protein
MPFMVKYPKIFALSFSYTHGFQWAVLHLKTKVKAIKASQKDKLIVKQIMAKFNAGKTWSE